jgi:N utilization substance protein B
MCCIDVRGNTSWDLVETFIRDSHEKSMIVDSAIDLLKGSFDDRQTCDELLSRHAHRWELDRLALVDRNILRIATYEFRRGDVPFKIIISEALKLAREFSTAESPRFINGVLDAIAKELAGTDTLNTGETGGGE